MIHSLFVKLSVRGYECTKSQTGLVNHIWVHYFIAKNNNKKTKMLTLLSSEGALPLTTNRKKNTPLAPPTIAGEVVEEVKSFKFLGTTISSDLKWDENFSSAIKKAHQWLFFLRQLKKFKVSHSILTQFYRTAIESILTFSITVWYSSACQKDKDQLERIVWTASKIIGSDMKPVAAIHFLRSDCKVMAIVQDTSHPANHLFQPLPSGCRYRAMRARTSRFQNSFYPQAIRSFSKWSVG